MSRVGKKPIPIPDGVEVKLDNATITVKGQHGELSFNWHPNMDVVVDQKDKEIRVSRPDDSRTSRALHGLTRSLINNMVQGVTSQFEKRLEIVGVGYQALLNGQSLELQVGFSNTVKLTIPDIVTCELPDNSHIVFKSVDKQAVGQFAADVRRVRPPEPYKGKGIRYQDEHVRRKTSKAFAGGA